MPRFVLHLSTIARPVLRPPEKFVRLSLSLFCLTRTHREVPRRIRGTMKPSVLNTNGQLEVRPWHDPVIEANGFTIGDPYVEMFWLPVLGPTATWLLRRLATGLDHEPQGYTVDMNELARCIGVACTEGRHNPFTRALQRCIMFGVSHHVPSALNNAIAVRTVLPPISQRHLVRLPEQLQNLHHDWSAITT